MRNTYSEITIATKFNKNQKLEKEEEEYLSGVHNIHVP
jgi:hypothetical protein